MSDPVEPIEPRPSLFPESGPNSLASIGQRFVARLIDGVILVVPLLLITWQFAEIDTEADRFDLPGWAFALNALVPVIYETVLIASRGQTIGKATMGIRVRRLTDGENPTPWQAGIRVLLPVALGNLPLGFIATVLSLAVYLVAFSNPLRQGWHDRAAGTVVVRTR